MEIDDAKKQKYFDILEGCYRYYFSNLPIEPYEYDIYNNIMEKIRKGNYDFTESDIQNLLKLITILYMRCDEYEIKVMQILHAYLYYKF